MVELWRRAKTEAGYNATRFLTRLSEHGGVATARRLVAASTPSDGFTALWEKGRLDLTVEALVLDPTYHDLFDEDLRQAAQRRFDAYPVAPPDGPCRPPDEPGRSTSAGSRAPAPRTARCRPSSTTPTTSSIGTRSTAGQVAGSVKPVAGGRGLSRAGL